MARSSRSKGETGAARLVQTSSYRKGHAVSRPIDQVKLSLVVAVSAGGSGKGFMQGGKGNESTRMSIAIDLLFPVRFDQANGRTQYVGLVSLAWWSR
ncbi:hypothetical protein PV08_09707 [Exophiala spinifera]|uniref:Uncharacterized protein n=1 Tax=Exophiala spinifera TaxID=91928 RepID=A0A0D2B191_9EURO|nr:uncharacterized protein PV08_09707 [Exophiala spinifera]KIW12430.1 hypothetical protein PV08_09707 [Exophiala spinifera]